MFLATVAVPLCVCGAEPELRVDLGGGVAIDFVLVKAGTFEQGSPDAETGRNPDESPRRNVTISRDFYLAKFPVTRGQFARFVAATGYRTESEKGTSGGFGFDGEKLVQARQYTWRNPGFEQTDDHPVTIVAFDDALAMARWLSNTTGREFSLPSEAQWEYACRAGTTTPYYSGSAADAAAAIAWCKPNAGNGTRQVGRLKANAWGFYDMSGNVFEWCADWYAPYAAGDATDPVQTRSDLSDKPRRVLRGGSWLREARMARSAARYRNDKGSRNADNGFRLASAAVDEPPARPPETERSDVNPPPLPRGEEEPPPATRDSRASDRKPPGENDDRFGRQHDSASDASDESGSAIGGAAWAVLGIIALGALGAFLAWLIYMSRGAASGDEFAALANRGVPRSRDAEEPSRFAADAPSFDETPRRAMPAALQPRVVVDGFWIDGLTVPGVVVAYRYVAEGQPREGRFTTEPGQTSRFIYTGSTPSAITITTQGLPTQGKVTGGELLPDQRDSTTVDDIGSPVIVFDDNEPEPPRRSTDAGTFRGFPSAY